MAGRISPNAYLEAAGESGLENWPALPFWGAVDSLESELRKLPDSFESRAVRNAFLTQFVVSVANNSRPAVTSEVVKAGGDWNAPAAAWSTTIDQSFRERVSSSYPVLQSRADLLAKVFAESARQLVLRLNDPAVQDKGVVSHVRLLGDMHLRGAVALLYFDGVPSLVYKPRSLAVDTFFSSVLEVLRQWLPEKTVPRHPQSIDRGDYGFQEYVKYSSPGEGEERDSFYEQFGSLIALAYALSFTDLHNENVRCTQTGPMVLDAECLLNFSPRLQRGWSPAAHSLFSPPASVFDSGLIPNWRMTFRSAGAIEVSALGRYEHPDRLPLSRKVVLDGEAISYKYERSTFAGKMPHQPEALPGTFPAGPHQAAILNGFTLTYRVLIDTDVQGAVMRIAQTASMGRARLVLADTAAYGARLQSSKRTVENVPNVTSPLQSWINVGERRALEHGVVPLFERRLGSGALLAEDGAFLDTVDSPIERLNERLKGLSHADEAAQLIGLRLSLGLGAYNPSDGRPPAIVLQKQENLRAAIDELVDRASEALHGGGTQPWALTSDELTQNYWSLRSTPPGLYSGVAGIAYSLGVAGLEHKKARSIYARLRAQLQDALTDFANLELGTRALVSTTLTGSGYLGSLLSLVSVAVLEGDGETLAWATRIGRRLAEAPIQIHGVDFIGGASGVAIGFRRLHELTGEPDFLSLEQHAQDRIVSGLPAMVSAPSVPVGLAHGLSGVAIALKGAPSAARAIKDEDTAALCLNLEDEHIRSGRVDIRGSSRSWCWGATGQLAARLICGPGSDRIDELRSEVKKTQSKFRNICHGTIGPVLLMRSGEYRQRFGSQDAERSSIQLTNVLLADPSSRAGAPGFAPDPGLYTGAAGVLVYLSSIRDGANFSLQDLKYEPSLE